MKKDYEKYAEDYRKLSEVFRHKYSSLPWTEYQKLKNKKRSVFWNRLMAKVSSFGYTEAELRGCRPGDVVEEICRMTESGLADPIPVLFDWCIAEDWIWWWEGGTDAILSEDWPDDGHWEDMGVVSLSPLGEIYEDCGSGSYIISREAESMR